LERVSFIHDDERVGRERSDDICDITFDKCEVGAVVYIRRRSKRRISRRVVLLALVGGGRREE